MTGSEPSPADRLRDELSRHASGTTSLESEFVQRTCSCGWRDFEHMRDKSQPSVYWTESHERWQTHLAEALASTAEGGHAPRPKTAALQTLYCGDCRRWVHNPMHFENKHRGYIVNYPAADEVFESLWAYWCIREISFAWDQWMRCDIRCTHGTYTAVSNGLFHPMHQSLGRAAQKFLDAPVTHDYED